MAGASSSSSSSSGSSSSRSSSPAPVAGARGGIDDFAAFNVRIQKALVSTTHTAVAVPVPSELKYARALDRKLGKKIDASSTRLLSMTGRILDLARTMDGGATSHGGTGKGKGKAREELEEEDLTDRYQRTVVDVTDRLLERIDTSLDQARKAASSTKKNKPRDGGLLRADAPGLSTAAVPSNATQSHSYSTQALPRDVYNAQSIPKPQLSFDVKPDNARDAVWEPLITSKTHHALAPLDLQPVLHVEQYTGKERMRIPNPYAQEIDKALERELPPLDEASSSEGEDAAMSQEEADEAKMSSQMKTKPFTFVNTPELLRDCLEKLKKANAVAIDLEHHDYRSFRGLTCLMQISTVHEDFIVDPLVPAVRSAAPMLNEVFASPDIVKVLHGSDYDVIWLQRDLGLYLVNLFDTFHASKLLGRTTGHSLASLLQEHTYFLPDKRYQLADWRIRPLPEEMLNYARSDTHFLLHVYRRLVTDKRMTPDMLKEVRRRSAGNAKQAYEHASYDIERGEGSGGWRKLVERAGKEVLWGIDSSVSAREKMPSYEVKGRISLAVFRAMHEWRDRKARELDESTRYILSNKTMFALAEKIPSSMTDLTATLGKEAISINKLGAKEFLNVIREAKKAEEAELGISNDDHTSPAGPASTGTEAKQANGFTAAEWSQLGWDDTPADFVQAYESTLFPERKRDAVNSPAIARPLATVASILFPTASSSTATGKKEASGSTPSAFAAVLAKVRATFSQPSLPSQPVSQAPTSQNMQRKGDGEASPSSADEQGGAATVQPSIADGDHAFVQKNKRDTLPPGRKTAVKRERDAWGDDEVVAVSRKSKRTTHADSPGKKNVKKEQETEAKTVEPFDYSTVKSVLDQKPSQTEQESSGVAGGRKKGKQGNKEKGGNKKTNPGLDYQFKNAPKSMNQPKSGNKAQTFIG